MPPGAAFGPVFGGAFTVRFVTFSASSQTTAPGSAQRSLRNRSWVAPRRCSSEPTYCLELMELGQRLQDATDGEIAALKAVGWADMGDDE